MKFNQYKNTAIAFSLISLTASPLALATNPNINNDASSIADVDDEVAQLASDLSAHATEINTLTTATANQANSIASNSNSIASNTSDLSAHATEINTLTLATANQANSIAANSASISDIQADLNALLSTSFATQQQQLTRELQDIRKTAYSGIASAIALSSVKTPSAPGKTAISFGMGHYEGENAIGVNVTHALKYFAEHQSTVSFGVANSQGNTAGRISAGFEF